MTRRRLFAIAAPALALVLASSATAAPLPLSDLLRLASEGVGEPVLLSITRHQGIAGPLDADQVLLMSRGGWSDELMSAVVEAAAKSTPAPAGPARDESAGAVVYEERDGAVVARLHGNSDDGTRPPPVQPPPVAPPPPQVVVVQAAPAAPYLPRAEGSAAPARDENGFPVGAVHGYQGSTVFLPARFGGSSPSAFGRTITSTGGGYYGTPYGPPLATYGYGGPVLPTVPTGQTTLIRTSRGTRRIPN